MKGERRWTQGGIGKYARLAGAPAGRNVSCKRETKSFLESRFGILLGFQAGGKTDRSDSQSPSVSPLSSTCLTLRRTLRSKCATSNISMTYEHVQHVRSYAWHIVGAGTEGPARGPGPGSRVVGRPPRGFVSSRRTIFDET